MARPRALPQVVTDAFEEPSEPTNADANADDEALKRLESVEPPAGEPEYVPDSQVREPNVAFTKLEMMATLLSGGFTAGQSNVKYALGFEVDLDGFTKLTGEFGRGKGGYDVTWNQIAVGQGVEVVGGTFNRDADGQPRFKFKVLLPQSELAHSIGRLGAKAKSRAKLVLEPMQGSLGLADGTEVDLTARAQ